MDTVRLHSGREVIIRPIRPTDAAELQAAYDRLSPRAKYLRFMAVKPHLNASETRYLVSVDGRDHVALVAAAAERPERIVAVARFVRLREAPDTAESRREFPVCRSRRGAQKRRARSRRGEQIRRSRRAPTRLADGVAARA